MLRRIVKITLLFLLFFLCGGLQAQEKYIDESTKIILDSLDARIEFLHARVKKFGANRDAKYFYTKREIDMTVFVREYEEMVFDENLVEAQRLIESRIKTSEKRMDTYAIDYYKGYQTKLTKLRGRKRAQYQELFEKEKAFNKVYKKYIEPADEQAYIKTHRMLDLAINYAKEMGRDETLLLLMKYKNYTSALVLDLHSKYELDKLTSSVSSFEKVFEPLRSSDSLTIIIEGQDLVNLCFNYSALALTKIDSNFFEMQKVVVANAIADWNEKQGISSELASLTGQAIIARRDTLNKEGIYQWNDYILVIGSVIFNSKSESLRKGEAIIDADRTLYNYLRLNKVAKTSKSMQMGKTYLLPIKEKDEVSYFRHDAARQAWQYMVAYTFVISVKTTQEVARFLPPLQFQDSISEIELQHNTED